MANKKPASSLKSSGIKAKITEPFHFKGRRFHLLFALSILVFCFAIYGNSIPNGYSLDDEFVLHGDSIVQKGIKGIPKLFESRYAWDQKGAYGYRPVVKTSFAIEYQFFGVSPAAGHIINILIYSLAVLSLFYFLRNILYDQVSDYFLFLVTWLFLAHPLHTEAVDSLKNRDVILAFLFGLFSTYAFIKCFETDNIVKRILWIIAACISINIGYLAKPDAILFIAITPLVLYFFKTKNLKSGIIAVVCMLVSGFVRGKVVRHMLPHSDYHRTFLFFENPLLGSHWYQRIQLGFASLWFYISKLTFPKDLISYYGYDEFHPFPKWTDINVLLGIIAAGLIIWFIYKNIKSRSLWLFSLLLFAGTVLIYVNVVRVGPGIVAERFMFIPSVGFVLVLSLLLYQLFKTPLMGKLMWGNSTSLLLAGGLVVALYSIRVIVRNPNWKSHLSLYAHDAKLAPRSAKLQSLLAAAYIDEIKKNKSLSEDEKGNYYQLAEKAFMASVDIYPTYATSLNNIGMIEYLYYKNMNTALEYFNKALAVDSNYTEAWFNAGSSYRELNNLPMAEKCFLQTIQVNPQYDMAYIFLSRLYTSEGKYDEVLKLNEDALKKGHATDAIYVNIGKIYLMQGDTTVALGYFDKALSYFSRNENLLDWLANYYYKKKDAAKAQSYIRMKEAAEAFTQKTIKQQ